MPEVHPFSPFLFGFYSSVLKFYCEDTKEAKINETTIPNFRNLTISWERKGSKQAKYISQDSALGDKLRGEGEGGGGGEKEERRKRKEEGGEGGGEGEEGEKKRRGKEKGKGDGER